jgi:hypothetical protein
MEQHQELLLDVPEIPQRFFGDRERAQMHHRLEKGEIRLRVTHSFDHRQLKARLQARQINRGPVQGFGEIGEGVHGADQAQTASTPC